MKILILIARRPPDKNKELRKMKKLNEDTLNTIVAFHIGRGGRNFNSGHLSFLGEFKIDHFTSNLFSMFDNQKKLSESMSSDDRDLFNDLIAEGKFTEIENKFGISVKDLGEEMYYDESGNGVGLAVNNDGIGRINEDGEYDTTYTTYIKDLTEHEIEAMRENITWGAVREYIGALDKDDE